MHNKEQDDAEKRFVEDMWIKYANEIWEATRFKEWDEKMRCE